MQTEQFLATFKGKRYEHIWGYEVWIENNEIYCNKLLVLNKGYLSSWHYHEHKDETFIILKGSVGISSAQCGTDDITYQILEPGDTFRIKPGLVHSFHSLSIKSIVMEVSTTDDDDNVKLKPAREIAY